MATPTSSSRRTYSRFQPTSAAEDHAEVHHGLHPTVSASVGHDHWANDVLKAVDKAKSSSGSTASGSNSPESYCDGASDGGGPRPPAVVHPADLVASVKAKVLEKKRKFHTGRSLELKNLPDGCVEQDIRDAFPDLGIVSVTIERNDGRYKASAKLTLDYPEILDDWPESRQNVFVRNKEVSVCVGNSDGWLCVAKLPLSYTDEEFFNLASAYGKVREAFLMISERTGESKGYGLIKYVSSEAAAQARHLLDGRSVSAERPTEVYKLDCDWLNSSHISFGSLHSKALYVDNLPPDFRDMTDFRKLFSVIKPPPYCQIAMPKGVIQDWGLVEFFNPMDSEETQKASNLVPFHGRRIRVHFCIPGVNAINIYMQAVNAPPDTKKKALLQDTPTANVYSQLQKLAAQNPAFAQNLQNIIQEQIQNLSSGTSLLPNMASTVTSSASTAASQSTSSNSAATPVVVSATAVPTNNASSCSVVNSRPASYSVVPTAVASLATLPQPQPAPPPTCPTATAASSAVTAAAAAAASSSNNINSNAQAALMILLTAQMQSQSGEPSLLQNPQVVSVLQNLVNNAGGEKPAVDLNDLMKDPSLASVFRPTQLPTTQTTTVTNNGLSSMARPALLDTPKSRPILLSNPPPSTSNNSGGGGTPTAAASETNAVTTNNLNTLLNTQNLNQLLGSLTNSSQQMAVATAPSSTRSDSGFVSPADLNPQQQQQPPAAAVSVASAVHTQPQQQQALLGAIPTSLASNGLYQHPHQQQHHLQPQQQHHQQQHQAQRQVLYDGSQSLLGFPYSAAAGAPGNPTAAAFYIQQQPQQQLYQQPPALFGLQGFAHPTTATNPAAAMATNPQAAAAFLNPNSMAFANHHPTHSSIMNSLAHHPQVPTMSAAGYHHQQAPIGTSAGAVYGTPPSHSLKRKISIPPTPEQSPEGHYIGQHSQGLGGHYASSYMNKKAKY